MLRGAGATGGLGGPELFQAHEFFVETRVHAALLAIQNDLALEPGKSNTTLAANGGNNAKGTRYPYFALVTFEYNPPRTALNVASFTTADQNWLQVGNMPYKVIFYSPNNFIVCNKQLWGKKAFVRHSGRAYIHFVSN